MQKSAVSGTSRAKVGTSHEGKNPRDQPARACDLCLYFSVFHEFLVFVYVFVCIVFVPNPRFFAN